MKFLGQGFQKSEHHRQTDTQTDATENITVPCRICRWQKSVPTIPGPNFRTIV